jgi:hypothetical protein
MSESQFHSTVNTASSSTSSSLGKLQSIVELVVVAPQLTVAAVEGATKKLVAEK